jgi:hypothetical protein
MTSQTLIKKIFCAVFFFSFASITSNVYAQIKGCTDPLANNYNSGASLNDGTCTYDPATINTESSVQLPVQMKGTSGLIWMNNKLWTENNFSDINLYSFLPEQVNNFETTPLTGTKNIDWEEITQDDAYVYIGDFGNNVNGNRTDLQILRIQKNSLLQPPLKIDTIKFSYATQTNFTPTGSNRTNYDCEAFVVTQDSIYLFTKEWLTNKTSLYQLPKTPGTYNASLVAVLDVQGLITGAMLLESKRLLVLCGYNSTLQPFVYLLYDYSGARFFEGNKRKLNLNLAFHQVEAITTQDGLNYHITNEYFSQFGMTVPQKLHELNLGAYLSRHLSVTNTQDHFVRNTFNIYPVPAKNFIQIDLKSALHRLHYSIVDSRGSVVQQGIWTKEMNRLEVDRLSSGLYWVILSGEKTYVKQWVKE